MSSYISGFVQLGRVLLRSRKLSLVQVPTGGNIGTMYHRKVPPWARYALVLIAVDVMVVSSVVEYTWDIGERVQSLTTKSPPENSSQDTPDSLALKTLKSVQTQPVWKKTVYSGVHIVVGACMAFAILGGRARLIHTMNYTKNGPPVLYIQAANHPAGYGFAFPVRSCTLRPSPTPNSRSQMLVRVSNHGGWMLDLKNATIEGKMADALSESRKTLERVWKKMGGNIQRRPGNQT